MNIRLIFIPLLAAALLGCQPADQTAGTAGKSTGPVAMVNGKPVSREVFDLYLTRRSGNGSVELTPMQRRELLNQVINVNLLAEDALSAALHQRPESRAQLEIQRAQLLANMAIEHYLETHPVTEDALRAEYQRRIEGLDGKEYKARHILLESREEAEAVIAQLEQGADFAELASRSIEPGAAERGGDLGWFQAQEMVEPFARAVKAMEPDQYSREPVQTRFGWHVISLEETREVPPPAFEDLRPRLESMLQQQAIEDYVQALRGRAEVDIRLQDESAAPAAGEVDRPAAQ